MSTGKWCNPFLLTVVYLVDLLTRVRVQGLNSFIRKCFKLLGLYCNFIGNQAEWERPIKDYKCLPTIPAILGGEYGPIVSKR